MKFKLKLAYKSAPFHIMDIGSCINNDATANRLIVWRICIDTPLSTYFGWSNLMLKKNPHDKLCSIL